MSAQDQRITNIVDHRKLQQRKAGKAFLFHPHFFNFCVDAGQIRSRKWQLISFSTHKV
jgi:hypothetical protein